MAREIFRCDSVCECVHRHASFSRNSQSWAFSPGEHFLLGLEAVDDCIAANVRLVWLHDALSPGAAIPEAIEKLRASCCIVIPGLCPMFFLKPVDPAHFCLRWILRLTGKERRARGDVAGEHL
jgi:hypothetical protein